MDARQEIIKSLSEEGLGSEEEIDDIIRWIFNNINKSTSLYENIEVSGLGNFIFNLNKSKHILKSLLSPSCNSRDIEKQIDYINKKHEQAERDN